MENARNEELSDRRAAGADAKTALLNAHQAAKAAAEPTRLARQAERIAIASAREDRRLERDREKLVERQRFESEAAEQQAAADAALQAEHDSRLATENARIARVVEDEAARKAERDRRYANRKARQS